MSYELLTKESLKLTGPRSEDRWGSLSRVLSDNYPCVSRYEPSLGNHNYFHSVCSLVSKSRPLPSSYSRAMFRHWYVIMLNVWGKAEALEEYFKDVDKYAPLGYMDNPIENLDFRYFGLKPDELISEMFNLYKQGIYLGLSSENEARLKRMAIGMDLGL